MYENIFKVKTKKEPIPYNYQHLLTGVIHKWIGKDNEVHGKTKNFLSLGYKIQEQLIKVCF